MSVELIARIEALEKRVISLEGKVHKNHHQASAIVEVIRQWPGPFTASRLRKGVALAYPQIGLVSMATLRSKLQRMVHQSQVVCLQPGKGQAESVFMAAANVQPSIAGQRRGTHHVQQSGGLGVIRGVLEELPQPFTRASLVAFVNEYRSHSIPDTSWSGLISALMRTGEIRKAGRDNNGRWQYERGIIRVTPTGDELGELENAWQTFRAGINAEIPDLLPTVEKHRGAIAGRRMERDAQ